MSAPSAPRTERDCALLGIGANLAPQRLWPMLLHRRERLWTLADASGRRCRPTWSRLHSADELWRVTARPRAAGFFVAGGGRVGAAAADVPRPPMRRARRRRLTGRGPRSGIVARLLSTGEAPRDRPTVDSPAVGRCAPHRQQSGRDLAVVKPRRQGAPRRARGWRAGYHFRARNGTVPCWLRRSKRRLANGPCGGGLVRDWRGLGVRECADWSRVYPTRREGLKPKSQRLERAWSAPTCVVYIRRVARDSSRSRSGTSTSVACARCRRGLIAAEQGDAHPEAILDGPA
jgi:hypothetical protein